MWLLFAVINLFPEPWINPNKPYSYCQEELVPPKITTSVELAVVFVKVTEDGGKQDAGSNSSAPISTVVDPAIGRESPSMSFKTPTELSPALQKLGLPHMN